MPAERTTEDPSEPEPEVAEQRPIANPATGEPVLTPDTNLEEEVDRDEPAGDPSHDPDPGDDRPQDPDQGDDRRGPAFTVAGWQDYRVRWDDVQTSFVDEPRTAVEEAGVLVTEVITGLAASFASERRSLEREWSEGGDVSTEDLRVGLRRYRSFFDRLLAI